MARLLLLGVLCLWLPLQAHADAPAASPHLAQSVSPSQGQICFSNCVQQFGTDARATCAQQCGLVGNPLGAVGASGAGTGGGAGSGQARDCGVIYKSCLAECRGDDSCKNACRKARTACF